ncbi:MAG: hypothetical protein IJE23_06370 [Tyzzerella sp.]|nr:hypothetical protein [Tyzzerella sp.]
MKKKIFTLFGVIFILAMFVMACGNEKKVDEAQKIPSKPAENQFDAKVIEIYDEYIMLEALEGQDVVGKVRIQTGLLSQDEILEIEKGDTVRITHDEKMTMSIPPQMTAIEIMLIN